MDNTAAKRYPGISSTFVPEELSQAGSRGRASAIQLSSYNGPDIEDMCSLVSMTGSRGVDAVHFIGSEIVIREQHFISCSDSSSSKA
jgi:hypothetical protein